MEVRASWSYASISPRKLRLVADKVRGMNAEQALVVLQFMPQKGAEIVHKLVSSALANAENNFELARADIRNRLFYCAERHSCLTYFPRTSASICTRSP